jgi:hypothetical protein
LCGNNVFPQDCGTAGGLGSNGRGLRLGPLCEWSFGSVGWGGVKLIEWFAEGVGCEYFNRFFTEVGGDSFLTYPFECSSSVSRS